MTVEAWVRPANRSRARRVVLQQGSRRIAFALLASPAARATTGRRVARVRGRTLRARAWSHLATTWDGRRLRLYVNGRKVATRRLLGRMVRARGPLRIGGGGTRASRFRGRIDELRIFDHARSGPEIRSDAGAPLSPAAPGGQPVPGSPSAPAPIPTGPPSPAPLPGPPPDTPCVLTVASAAAAEAALQDPRNTDVCFAAGSYAKLDLRRARTTFVIARPVPGAAVTIAGATLHEGAAYYRFQKFAVRGNFDFLAGANHVQVVYNDIAPAPDTYSAILGDTTDCTVAHAPTYSGCEANPPMTDVLVQGNRFHDYRTEENRTPLRPTNWRRLTIVENEITGVLSYVSAGGEISHTDCFQSVYGGDTVTFARNYLHDNRCQGFFIKDGDASNVIVHDNLFVRNNVPPVGPGAGSADFPCGAPHTVTVQYITRFTETRNTVWPGACAGPNIFLESGGTDYRVEGNVINTFMPYDGSGDPIDHYQQVMFEDRNVFCDGWTWVPAHIGPHSRRTCTPAFVDPSHDDYRLSGPVSAGGETFAAGVSWRPADYHYGP
jgi:hypothetical protein